MLKKIFKGLLGLALVFTMIGCANQSTDEPSQDTTENKDSTQTTKKSDSKVLIAYFSKTGNTKEAAQEIQTLTDGTLVEIIPVESYPDSYQETVDIAENELETKARPAIQDLDVDLSEYDTIFLGYPIWWHDAPMVIYTFLENNDLNGKTVIPFCTSGGSTIEEGLDGIKAAAKGANVLDGFTANNTSDIESLLQSIEY